MVLALWGVGRRMGSVACGDALATACCGRKHAALDLHAVLAVPLEISVLLPKAVGFEPPKGQRGEGALEKVCKWTLVPCATVSESCLFLVRVS